MSTWPWLGQAAAQLNRTVAAAAARYGWTLVPPSALFSNRGYRARLTACSSVVVPSEVNEACP